VKSSWLQDPVLQKLITSIQTTGAPKPYYRYHAGILSRKGKMMVGSVAAIRKDLIALYHDSSSGGHSGMTATLQRLRQDFYWKKMKQDVYAYVRCCDVCQRCKGENVAYPGLLQPLPIPDKVWQDISMDFIEGLPRVAGHEVIFVVVDRLSKAAHFMALKHPYSAVDVAQSFMSGVFKLHGMPKTIVSDRDPIFTSRFWKELFKLQKVTLLTSSAYHPQTDGQTEVVNRCLECYLRCMTFEKPREWPQWLALAEWWYNTTFHSAINMTPYSVVYGQSPPPLLPYMPFDSQLDLVDRSLQAREATLRCLKAHLARAQSRMKSHADKGRTDRSYVVGDWVYIKLHPYRQTSLKSHAFQKLSAKFFGPFQILARVGPVAYTLQLPPDSKIHPTFHISQLKKKLGSHIVSATLPEIHVDAGHILLTPQAILDRRIVKKHGRPATQLLIKWFNAADEDSTWEDFQSFTQQFPHFNP